MYTLAVIPCCLDPSSPGTQPYTEAGVSREVGVRWMHKGSMAALCGLFPGALWERVPDGSPATGLLMSCPGQDLDGNSPRLDFRRPGRPPRTFVVRPYQEHQVHKGPTSWPRLLEAIFAGNSNALSPERPQENRAEELN